ncbi:hypothetical protein MOZ60_03740 [Stecheria sp. CLA-KB-P133]|uniref:X-X-X-Leu-X-X-Gly heptad repeats n=1 Tax=Grylomicrobium aquisgranensis TaxID=2926318 RepID=A0AB35U1E3_9FIRM|nr:hypothetical protein [Stecheria sp. CLA-KB-P133]
MKKFIIKATTLAGVGTLLVTGALPVNAEDTTSDGTTKDESVYVVLNADGSVSSVTVSDQLHNANGFSNYQDKSDLKNVQNLKSDDPVQSSSDGYTWTTTDTDIYYQGKTTKALPLDTTIEYKLDGKTVDPKDIVGKSGHLSMTFNIKNTQTKQYTIDGKTYTVCQPFYVAAGGMPDQDHFTNVKIDHGTVSTDTSHSIALAVMMPGMKDSIGQFLTGDLSSLNDYLFDTVTIEADVTDFESPTMMMAASTDLSALKGELKDDGAFDTTDLFDQLDELDAATQKLIDGSKALYEGADQLKDGANQVNDGVGTLVNGTSTLTDGTSQLAEGGQALVDGANQASAGAAALQAGLGQLVSKNDTLVSGANKIADAVLSSAQTQLREQLKNNSITLTWDNYADVLGDYNNINNDMRAQAKQKIRSAVEAQTGPLDESTFNGILYMCASNGCTSEEDIKNFLKSNTASLETANAVATAQNDAALIGKNDFSKIDSILNLALYESSISTTGNTIKAATGVTVTNAQAEAVWLAIASHQIQSDNLAAIENIINNIPADQTQRGIHDETVQSVLKGMRTQATYSNEVIYSGICATLKSMKITDATQQAILVTIAGELHGDAGSTSDAFKGASADVTTATNVKNMITDGNKEENQSLINGMLNTLALPELKSELAGVTKQLQDVRSFVAGLETYTAHVQSAYTGSTQLVAGLTALTSGADTLNAGIQKVNTGAESLSSGAKTLKDGTQTLSDGATQLSDGAKTLYDGLVQYNEEGISKLTQNSDLDNLQTASKLISDIQNDDDAYVNYSGISDGTDGTVKFIYKISTVKSEADTEKDAASKSDDTSDVQESSDKGNFFTRLADLFIFWN